MPTINEHILKSLKFKPLPSGHWKHEEKISVNATDNLKPHPNFEAIPPNWTEWFQDVKEMKE